MKTDHQEYVRSFDDPKLEALIETMFLAAYADGEFSEVEREHFAGSVQALTDGRMTGAKFDELVDRVIRDLAAGGRDKRLAAIKERLADAVSRKVALSLAVQLMVADGIVRTSERELIMDMADALEIDRDEAANIVAGLTG